MEEWLHRRQQLVDGRSLKGDGSHKVSKLITVKMKTGGNEGVSGKKAIEVERPIVGFYTILNGSSQLVFQKPMFQDSLSPLRADLKLFLLKRVLGFGFALADVFFTDVCCDGRKLVDAIL
jgi:hypothetical protein